MQTTDTTPKLQTFQATVTITASAKAQAEQVLAERLAFDEDYGFDYTIGYGEIR